MYKILETNYEYKSNDPKGLVNEMRSECFIQTEDNEDFMLKSTLRFYNWDKTILNPTNEESFVESLINTNYLTINNN